MAIPPPANVAITPNHILVAPVAPNNPPTAADVLSAHLFSHQVKRAKRSSEGAHLAPATVASAVMFERKVENGYALAHDPAANPVAAAIAQACAPGGAIFALVNPMQQQLNQLQQQFNQQQQQFNQQQQTLNQLIVSSTNQEARRINFLATEADSALMPLVSAANVQPVQFPASRLASSHLTAAQLTALEQHYNLPGLGAAATIGQRIDRFQRYIGLRL